MNTVEIKLLVDQSDKEQFDKVPVYHSICIVWLHYCTMKLKLSYFYEIFYEKNIFTRFWKLERL